MKRGVLQFTACCLAAGMTFTGMTTVAFAAKDVTLAGFSGISTVTVENRVAQTETFETEAFQTESVQTEPPVAETAAESQPFRDGVP